MYFVFSHVVKEKSLLKRVGYDLLLLKSVYGIIFIEFVPIMITRTMYLKINIYVQE